MRQKNPRGGKKRIAFSDIIAKYAEVRKHFLHRKICCSTVNIKYNARVFLPQSATGTSEVTQNAQFILRGLKQIHVISCLYYLDLVYQYGQRLHYNHELHLTISLILSSGASEAAGEREVDAATCASN